MYFYSGLTNYGPLECQKLQIRENSYRIKSENETPNKKVLSRQQKVEKDSEDTMSSCKLF